MAGPRFLAGVELGGTKSIAVLARGTEIVEQAVLPTREPDETLADIARRLQAWNDDHDLAALGIASFGPIQLDPEVPGYGRMHATPKPGWTGATVAETLTRGLACPWTIDTDVNGAALAEYLWGAGQGTSSLCYLTIGTGVGGGLVIDGRPVHGAMHPEIGHLSLRRTPGDGFAGACPFHGDCIEGLVSGPALAARFGAPPERVPDDDPRWAAVASDLAELAGTILLTTSAQRILIGGGVGLARGAVLGIVGDLLVERMGGYLPFLDRDSARAIVRVPALGDRAGPLGSVALALSALKSLEDGREQP